MTVEVVETMPSSATYLETIETMVDDDYRADPADVPALQMKDAMAAMLAKAETLGATHVVLGSETGYVPHRTSGWVGHTQVVAYAYKA